MDRVCCSVLHAALISLSPTPLGDRRMVWEFGISVMLQQVKLTLNVSFFLSFCSLCHKFYMLKCLSLFAFSGWGVWQSRAPGRERRIAGIQQCSHSRHGSLLVTLWVHPQPVNMNKLSIHENVSSCSACCCFPRNAALHSQRRIWNTRSCVHEGFEMFGMQTELKTPEKCVQLVSLHR